MKPIIALLVALSLPAWAEHPPAPSPDPQPVSNAGADASSISNAAAGVAAEISVEAPKVTLPPMSSSSGAEASNAGVNAGSTYASSYDALALGLPAVPRAQAIMTACHESHGGKGGFSAGSGGRVELVKWCVCTQTALDLMRPPIGQVEAGLAVLNQCGLYRDPVSLPAAPPPVDCSERQSRLEEFALSQCGKSDG